MPSRGAPRVMASTAATFSSSSRAMLAVLVACLALASSASAAGAAPTTNDGGAGGGGAGASRFLFQAATISDAVVPAGGALATCEVGVHECNADKYLKKVKKAVAKADPAAEPPTCASYNGRFEDPQSLKWVLGLSAVVGMLMSYGIGANDAANSWGTSVGSGAVTVTQAVILGGLMEWLGAVGLGYGVAKTIKGTSKTDDPECWACGYCDSEMSLYMVAMMSSLFAAALFLLLVTFTAMPVSTTHAIVGGTVGAAAVGVGWNCLNWKFEGGLFGIMASWVISPVLSGVIGLVTYEITHHLIIKARLGGSPRRNALISQPILWAGQTFVIVFLILLKAQPTKKLWSLEKKLMVAGICAGIVLLLIAAFLNPFVYRRMPSIAAKRRRDEESNGIQRQSSGSSDSSDISTGGVSGGGERRMLKGLQQFLERATTGGTFGKAIDGAIGRNGAPESAKSKNDAVAATVATVNTDGNDGAAAMTTTLTDENIQKVQDDIASCGAGSAAASALQHAAHDIIVTDTEERAKSKAAFLFSTSQITEDEFEAGMSEEEIDATFMFRYLLVFTAALESFAHGSNDTANATGPFSAVYLTYTGGLDDCSKPQTPPWIMAVAGFFVFLGVTTMGYRVIRTIGSELTAINYQRGFCIEFASTLTVVIATILEMPVSTTHCQVGAVVFVGAAAFGPKKVAWGMFGRIVLTWVLTLPIAGLAAAGFTAAFRPAVM